MTEGFRHLGDEKKTLLEIADVLGIDRTTVLRLSVRESWPFEIQTVKGGKRKVFQITALPEEIKKPLLLKKAGEVAAPAEAESTPRDPKAVRSPLWTEFERKPRKHQDEALRRRRVLEAVETMRAGGLSKMDAYAHAAEQSGESVSTLRGWCRLVKGQTRDIWLPLLAPRYVGGTAAAEVSPEAWNYFKADYLRAEQPTAEACYRRLQAAAHDGRDWAIPSVRTLVRKIEREVPRQVILLLREGPDALKRCYPAQERDRAVFHALEAVCADGHKWDVSVRWPDGAIDRPVTVFFSDIYSGKLLGWRTDRTENSDGVRLAFLDVVEKFGIPDHAYLDNGRGFASKWITGGAPNRYRFRVREDEPIGILPVLGIQVHWAKPYSGQSKPIERAFRDLAEDVSKHPAFAGAYVGKSPTAKPHNYGATAVPLEKFLAVMEGEIARHNARQGRIGGVCAGRSFDDVFAESYARSAVRKATDEQKRMLLLAAEAVTAHRDDGSVRLAGNRYWSEVLAALAGKKVVLRFDPQAMQGGVHVYRLDGSYAGFAACLEAAGFNDTRAARDHERARNQYIKSTKQAAQAEIRMTAAEVADKLPGAAPPSQPQEPKMVRPLFGRPTARGALAVQEHDDDAFWEVLQKATAKLTGAEPV